MGSVADDIGPEASAIPTRKPPARTTTSAAAPLPAAIPETEPVQYGVPSEPETEPVQYGVPPEPAPPAPVVNPAIPVAAGPVAAASERHYRQTIHRVDLWSVLKIAVCFYICGMAVTMVALVALWAIADAAGVIHSVEKFFGDLLQTKNFTFLSGEILRGALLVAAVVVVLQIVITVIAAAFYNLFAELFGGVEITISEDETAL
jgi:Transmembrane domain of unknown function (DUF3566)